LDAKIPLRGVTIAREFAVDLMAHGRDALREIKPRKCVRDDEKLVPLNICVGQGRPHCN